MKNAIADTGLPPPQIDLTSARILAFSPLLCTEQARTSGSVLARRRTRFCGALQVHTGEVLLFRIYIENSAADNLVSSNGSGPGVAMGVSLSVSDQGGPSFVASHHVVQATITATNTTPGVIGTSLDLTAPQTFKLEPIAGAVVSYTNAHPRGAPLMSSVWSGQALLGSAGTLQPGYQFAEIVTLKALVTYVSSVN